MAIQVKISETRSVMFVNGVQTFRIVVQCTDAGPMPDTHLFLKKIFDPQDPQQDIFERIAEIADLDTENADPDEPGYKPNRSAALGAGDIYWRTDEFTKDYTDIEVATAAVAAISDRVNTLVTDFVTFDTAFQTPATLSYYPSASPTTVAALKAAYDVAYATYEDSLTALTAAQTSLTSAEIAVTSATTSYNEWLSFLDDASKIATDAATVSADYGSFVTIYSKLFVGSVDKFVEDYLEYFPNYQRTTVEIQLNASPWTDFTLTEIGKQVTTTGTGETGILIAYDNVARTMLVTPDAPIEDNLFDTIDSITVSGSSGNWTMTAAATVINPDGAGPNIQELVAARERFALSRLENVTSVSQAASMLTLAESHKGEVQAKVNEKSSAMTAAQRGVTTAQEDFNKAQADVQTTYDDLESAYTNVKVICPNWSPVAVFPPLPSTS